MIGWLCNTNYLYVYIYFNFIYLLLKTWNFFIKKNLQITFTYFKIEIEFYKYITSIFTVSQFHSFTVLQFHSFTVSQFHS